MSQLEDFGQRDRQPEQSSFTGDAVLYAILAFVALVILLVKFVFFP